MFNLPRLSLPLLAAILACVALSPAQAEDEPPAQPAIGIWEGPLKVGPFENLVAFKIVGHPDGSLAATADVIDQGIKDLPCGKVTFADGKLTIEMPNLKGRYEGQLSVDGRSIGGRWIQVGPPMPLALTRVEKLTEHRRPQHPKQPFSYRVEEVTFDNPAARIALAGTLTLPAGDGPFPAVVLISGSGPQDRDETVFLHKPFLVLADHLTRKGIAVLRFDDRGVGKSQGQQQGATSADFATDAHTAWSLLRGRKEIDSRRIGLAGHSEGGWMAEMVAADHSDEVAFIILLANTGVPGEAVALAQAEDFSRSLGASDNELRLILSLSKELVAVIKTPGPADERRQKLTEAAQTFASRLTEKERQLMGAYNDSWWTPAIDRWSDPWLQFSVTYDPAATLRRVRCPVLAMIGEKDIQVRPKENLAAIAAALAAGGNQSVTIREMPGLKHLFQTSQTGLAAEYNRLEETFAPAALDTISSWILSAN
jgi:uncharacterized protein